MNCSIIPTLSGYTLKCPDHKTRDGNPTLIIIAIMIGVLLVFKVAKIYRKFVNRRNHDSYEMY